MQNRWHTKQMTVPELQQCTCRMKGVKSSNWHLEPSMTNPGGIGKRKTDEGTIGHVEMGNAILSVSRWHEPSPPSCKKAREGNVYRSNVIIIWDHHHPVASNYLRPAYLRVQSDKPNGCSFWRFLAPIIRNSLNCNKICIHMSFRNRCTGFVLLHPTRGPGSASTIGSILFSWASRSVQFPLVWIFESRMIITSTSGRNESAICTYWDSFHSDSGRRNRKQTEETLCLSKVGNQGATDESSR